MAITFTGGKTWANGDIANATNMNLIVNALTTSMATLRLLGRTTPGAGSFEEITPGAGLDYSSTAISVGWIDTNSTHYLRIAAGSDLTADRTLTLTTGDAARTITVNGNPTLNDWFDQSVKTTAGPTFASLSTGSGAISGGALSGTTGTFSGVVSLQASGSAGTPSLTFTGDTDTGISRAAANTIVVSANAAAVLTIDTTGLSVTGTLGVTGATNLDAGTVSAPGLYLEGETGTGLYRIGANNHGYAVSGSKVLDIASTGLGVTGSITATTSIAATTFLRAGTTTLHGTTVGATIYSASANVQMLLGQSASAYMAFNWIYNATESSAQGELSTTVNNPFVLTAKRVQMDTSVASSLRVENNGDVVFGADSALATNATAEFVHIRTMAGAPTGAPTNYTGHAVHCVDTTNGRAYYYYGAAWHYATLT